MAPNGMMVSKIMQQGDCNAGVTHQALMNHIFADYIEHKMHIRMVFDVLQKEKLYLSPHKMQLFANKLEILGHVITSEGI
ncbi:hypothetical protein FRC12_022600 [Ceratobasidium sp. 428]|nr:hypothetical protein FRC12_022600 [Ceratobasidium sp. 428]